MWTLSRPVKVIATVNGRRISFNRDDLAGNQGIYDMVKSDPVAWIKYGHNFVEGTHTPKTKQPQQKQEVKKDNDTIEVNVKKKEVVLKEAEPPASKESKPTVSTSKEAGTGGMSLNVSDKKPTSVSKDSGQPKRKPGRPVSSKGK